MLDWIKAKIFILLIGLNWGSFITMASPIMFVAYCMDRWERDKWFYSILLAQDHYTNVVMGGHFLTTVSAMLGHLRKSGSGTGTLLAGFVDWSFRTTTGQLNHCTVSMEEGDIFEFNVGRALIGTFIFQAVNLWVVYSVYSYYFGA